MKVHRAGVAAVGLFFMPLAILAGPQTPAWDKVDLTDSAAVRKYVEANPNANSQADATLALELHRRISRIRSGQLKSQLALVISEIDPRFIQTDGDSKSRYVLGIRKERTSVEGLELVKFGEMNVTVETAKQMGMITKDGFMESVRVVDVLGHPTKTLYTHNTRGSGSIMTGGSERGLRYPNVPGSIVAITSTGEYSLMNRVILRIPSGALYFSFIEGVGFAHIYGAGEARLSDGSTIELRD